MISIKAQCDALNNVARRKVSIIYCGCDPRLWKSSKDNLRNWFSCAMFYQWHHEFSMQNYLWNWMSPNHRLKHYNYIIIKLKRIRTFYLCGKLIIIWLKKSIWIDRSKRQLFISVHLFQWINLSKDEFGALFFFVVKSQK